MRAALVPLKVSNTLLFLLLENLRPTGRCGLVPLSEITLGELSLKSFEPNLPRLHSRTIATGFDQVLCVENFGVSVAERGSPRVYGGAAPAKAIVRKATENLSLDLIVLDLIVLDLIYCVTDSYFCKKPSSSIVVEQ